MQPVLTRLIAAMAFLLVPMTASAATVTHGDFMGSTVDFLDVLESSNDGELFEAPTIVDDTLIFSPSNFFSASTGPLASDIVDALLRFTVCAQDGEIIPFLLLEETGKVSLSGISGEFALAMVSSPIFYHIREIDGVPINGPQGSVNMSFSPEDGTFVLDSLGLIIELKWTGSALIDLDGILNGIPQFAGKRATKVEIVLDNTLSTLAVGEFALASIEKNSFTITVPEIPSGLLALTGLFPVVAVRLWRRSRASA
jgi:hypothetical protein